MAGLVAMAAGLRMGRGARATDGSGLASTGRSPEILMLKKTAAEKTSTQFSCLNYTNEKRYGRSACCWKSLWDTNVILKSRCDTI